jgi:hypothetical protein
VHRISITILLALFGGVAPLFATLLPPSLVVERDSVGTRVDKGVEFVRLTNSLAVHRILPSRIYAAAAGSWKTDWQTPEAGTDRRRQDGRWYVGVSRGLWKNTDFWLAARGEHFDDRPVKSAAAIQSGFDVTPDNPTVLTSSYFSSQSISSVRILRGGGGIRVQPWQPLTMSAAAGSVEDRRIGRTRSGFGLWTQAAVDHWNISGYEQSLSLAYNRETPREQTNEDIAGRYDLFHEFSAGNSNRTILSGGFLTRDVYFDATGQVAQRTERRWGIQDVLSYQIVEGLRTEVGGEILHELTEQGQADQSTSSLEENQAGFTTAIQGQRGKAEAKLTAGMRSVTQTVRGDILQGRKTDMMLQGRVPLPGQSTFALRLAVAKYVLDTRNENNYDDRDELRYNCEASWTKPLLRTMSLELHGSARLDHLVYIFRQSSANNRWTRFFLLGSTIYHRPTPVFDHRLRWNVSANYQAYDYETDPYTTRSTVHRRLLLADSATVRAGSRVTLSGMAGWQIEEFGRLFWDSFEEEKSDETKSLTASAQIILRIGRNLRTAAGGLWDSRKGRRFATETKSTNYIFQDLKSYGPTFMIDCGAGKRLRLTANARALRQFQLDRADRWIVTGEIIGAFKW